MGKCRGCCLIHARMLPAAETASFSWFGGAVPSPNIQGIFFHRPQSLRIYHDSIFLYFLRSLSYCMFFIKHTHSSQNGARRIELENRSGTCWDQFLFVSICNAGGYINDHQSISGWWFGACFNFSIQLGME